jgi:hypothetical protein
MTQQEPHDSHQVSFEEFKLYYETTEKVVDRRLSINRFNHSVSVATLVAIAALIKLGTDKASFVLFGVGTIVVLCAMAMIFCTFWIKVIKDYKKTEWSATTRAKAPISTRTLMSHGRST